MVPIEESLFSKREWRPSSFSSLPGTFPLLLWGERARTVDSGHSSFSSHYHMMWVLLHLTPHLPRHRLCLPFLLASLPRIYPSHHRNVNLWGLLPHSLREHKLHQKQKRQRRHSMKFKCPPQKTWKRAGLLWRYQRTVALGPPCQQVSVRMGRTHRRACPASLPCG